MWKSAVLVMFVAFQEIFASDISHMDLEETLRLVHVVFRHGNRTVDSSSIYPNDPYKNYTYFPVGVGELTNGGKQREFLLGEALRTRYDRFLGQLYLPNVLEAISSSYNRTIMSLELVLAGTFPPVGELVWNPRLMWQPIPITVLTGEADELLVGEEECPNYQRYYSEYNNSSKVQEDLRENQQIFNYLAEHAGKPITDYESAGGIYDCLMCEEVWGLPLPNWTKPIYPEPVRSYMVKYYASLSGTTNLRRVNAGYLLKKIIDDTQGKIDGVLLPAGRKIFFYSGHDADVAAVLGTLDVFDPQLVPYGAYVLFELHKIEDEYGFKIYYQNYTTPDPILMKLPNCDEFCPFSQFVELTKEYIPRPDTCGNN